MPYEVVLKRDKVTPGTVRYRESGTEDRPMVIYLLKGIVRTLGNPDSIKVTIDATTE